jgi:hypothetical protein
MSKTAYNIFTAVCNEDGSHCRFSLNQEILKFSQNLGPVVLQGLLYVA